MNSDPIIAVGLLTQKDLSLLGPTFKRVFPIDDSPAFADLLRAIDGDRIDGDKAKQAEPAENPGR